MITLRLRLSQVDADSETWLDMRRAVAAYYGEKRAATKREVEEFCEKEVINILCDLTAHLEDGAQFEPIPGKGGSDD